MKAIFTNLHFFTIFASQFDNASQFDKNLHQKWKYICNENTHNII